MDFEYCQNNKICYEICSPLISLEYKNNKYCRNCFFKFNKNPNLIFENENFNCHMCLKLKTESVRHENNKNKLCIECLQKLYLFHEEPLFPYLLKEENYWNYIDSENKDYILNLYDKSFLNRLEWMNDDLILEWETEFKETLELNKKKIIENFCPPENNKNIYNNN